MGTWRENVLCDWTAGIFYQHLESLSFKFTVSYIKSIFLCDVLIMELSQYFCRHKKKKQQKKKQSVFKALCCYLKVFFWKLNALFSSLFNYSSADCICVHSLLGGGCQLQTAY